MPTSNPHDITMAAKLYLAAQELAFDASHLAELGEFLAENQPVDLNDPLVRDLLAKAVLFAVQVIGELQAQDHRDGEDFGIFT